MMMMMNFLFRKWFCYEIMWKNIVESDRPYMTTWSMGIARWIPKATNAHSEYVILIAFPQQHWSHERFSMLRYTYTACLVTLTSGASVSAVVLTVTSDPFVRSDV